MVETTQVEDDERAPRTLTINTGDHSQFQVGQHISGSQWLSHSLREHQSAKRAEVAGKALTTTLHYLTALNDTLWGVDTCRPPLTTAARFAEKWDPIDALSKTFLEVKVEVQAYLGDAELQVVCDVWKFKAHLYGLQLAAVSSSWMWEQAYGDHHMDRLSALQQQVLDVLKPIATLAENRE